MFKESLHHLFTNGANWVKVDFHLHSPFVHSFKLPSGINLSSATDISKLIEDYVKKIKEHEIEICAITDYQQIRKEWFVPFQQTAAKNDIFVFPGVELSVTFGRGLHILLIFEYNSDIDAINRYIHSLHRNPQEDLISSDRSHRDIQLENKTIRDVLIDFKEKFDVLIIFPHPEDKNGLLRESQPKEAAEFIKLADAIEFISESSKSKLISTGFLDKKTVEEKLSVIENSDPKSLEEIGCKKRNEKTRCTYLKLSSASINAFRVTFQDPVLRVRTYNKPESHIDRIISINIEGNGFLKDIQIPFNKELNSLIGGRGVGKSAILESIRYCLDLPAYSEKSFREEFIKSVVGSGGKIELKFEKMFGNKTQPYRVSRIIGKQPVVENSELSPIELFDNKAPILIGQKELYHLSSNKEFQLNLIDELIGDEIKKEKQNFEKQLAKLDENARLIINLSNKISQKEGYEQELKTIKERIKIFEDLGVVKKMELNTTLHNDDHRLKTVINNITSEVKHIKEAFKQLIDVLENSKITLSSAESIEKNILIQTAEIVEKLKNEVLKNQEEFQSIDI